MSTADLSPTEIFARGKAALLKELGPTGYVRFLQQISGGHGDYTKEREQIVGKYSVEEIQAMIAERQGSNKG
jgi:hypothetical protein